VVARGDAESRAVPVIVLCSPLSNEPARKRQQISCSRIVATPLAASASEAGTPAGVRMDGEPNARWYRCAQPPAKGWDASGIGNDDARWLAGAR
jgi:hypothetical protein